MSSELLLKSYCFGTVVRLFVFFWKSKAPLERPLKAGCAESGAGALLGDRLLCPSGLPPLFSSGPGAQLAPPARCRSELGKDAGLQERTSAASLSA